MSKTNDIKVVWLGNPQVEAQEFNRILVTLGYYPYTLLEILKNEGHSRAWIDIMTRKKPLDFDLFDGYDSIVLTPPTIFYREIFKRYPDAKFILEDIDSATYYQRLRKAQRISKSMFFLRIFKRTGVFLKMADIDIYAVTKGDKSSITAQLYHNEFIVNAKKDIPSQQLLALKPGDGWEAVCDFLDKPIPNKKFPSQLNKTEINQTIWQIAVRGLRGNSVVLIIYFATLISLIIYLMFFY